LVALTQLDLEIPALTPEANVSLWKPEDAAASEPEAAHQT
jgi:hypothetical protein